MPSAPQFPSHVFKPTVLVVADDIFTMGDKSLMQSSRLAVPNTLKESSLVAANAANHQDPSWRPITGIHTRISDVNTCDGW